MRRGSPIFSCSSATMRPAQPANLGVSRLLVAHFTVGARFIVRTSPRISRGADWMIAGCLACPRAVFPFALRRKLQPASPANAVLHGRQRLVLPRCFKPGVSVKKGFVYFGDQFLLLPFQGDQVRRKPPRDTGRDS